MIKTLYFSYNTVCLSVSIETANDLYFDYREKYELVYDSVLDFLADYEDDDLIQDFLNDLRKRADKVGAYVGAIG